MRNTGRSASRRNVLLAVCCLASLFPAAGLRAATRDVCLSGCAYSSIQDAINASVAGDTVLVQDGTYRENIWFAGKAVTVKSVNGASSTVIDGSQPVDPNLGSAVRIDQGEGPTTLLEGFTITGGTGTLDYMGYRNGGGIYCPNGSPTVRGCRITGNEAYQVGGGIYSGSGAITIDHCEIDNNRSVWSAGGIRIGGSGTVKNSLVWGNSTQGSGGGFLIESGSPTIVNTSIFDNVSGDASNAVRCLQSYPTFVNCTITQIIRAYYSALTMVNTIAWATVNLNNGSTLTATYSDIAGGWPGEGNINADPLFVPGSLRLAPHSPCVDAGTPVGAPAEDQDLTPRPQGAGYDIGADELLDADGDGYRGDVDDCDDGNAAVNPGQPEIPYNGVDENCSGMADDDDLDLDGFAIAQDCNDVDPAIHPGVCDIKNDGIDQDCDGSDRTTGKPCR